LASHLVDRLDIMAEVTEYIVAKHHMNGPATGPDLLIQDIDEKQVHDAKRGNKKFITVLKTA